MRILRFWSVGAAVATIVAIDFETADQGPDSACAIGLARVQNGIIQDTAYKLIRPPRRSFEFTYIHGITWEQVRNEPAFDEIWDDIARFIDGADFLAAHYAPFDRRVLNACCSSVGIRAPDTPFICTVKLARHAWDVRPTRLPNVCEHLGIELNHHHALSDSEACARIVIAALEQGVDVTSGKLGRIKRRSTMGSAGRIPVRAAGNRQRVDRVNGARGGDPTRSYPRLQHWEPVRLPPSQDVQATTTRTKQESSRKGAIGVVPIVLFILGCMIALAFLAIRLWAR